ncbi:hypothetical protein [Hymenobacter sp.]|jgi:hypothetical protein|uniref:hypothetical protein n=1 Tax=Hymenobacter sp. TaxID=1898978 RepID=UPI002ED8775E
MVERLTPRRKTDYRSTIREAQASRYSLWQQGQETHFVLFRYGFFGQKIDVPPSSVAVKAVACRPHLPARNP